MRKYLFEHQQETNVHYLRMLSGAHGSTHNSCAREPGFDSAYTQTQDGIYSEAFISLLSGNILKNDVILWYQVEINNIIIKIIILN
jgi:hypothetical protein